MSRYIPNMWVSVHVYIYVRTCFFNYLLIRILALFKFRFHCFNTLKKYKYFTKRMQCIRKLFPLILSSFFNVVNASDVSIENLHQMWFRTNCHLMCEIKSADTAMQTLKKFRYTCSWQNMKWQICFKTN